MMAYIDEQRHLLISEEPAPEARGFDDFYWLDSEGEFTDPGNNPVPYHLVRAGRCTTAFLRPYLPVLSPRARGALGLAARCARTNGLGELAPECV